MKKLKEHIHDAEQQEELDPQKFDRHMKKARKDDISSRQQIFISQSKTDKDKEERKANINPSTY